MISMLNVIARFCSTAILCVALGACADRERWHEVDRVASPDQVLDAVLSESKTDSGTSFVYHVHVIPTGTAVVGDAVALLDGAMRNTTSFGVGLKWTASRTLEVRYLKANPAQVDEGVTGAIAPDLRVLLIAGVYDPDATSGGMRFQRDKAVPKSLQR